MSMNIRTGYALLGIGLLYSANVLAESARRESGSDSVARVQNMVRQLTMERDALKTENAGIKAQLDKLTAQLSASKKDIGAVKAKAAQADVDSKALLERYKETDAALRDRLTSQNEKMQQLVDKYRELVASLRQVEAKQAASQEMVISQAREIDRCVENNVQLYQTGVDLLEEYGQKGVWDALLEAEPVTQIKRVKLENLIQDYRGRLQAAHVQRQSAAAVETEHLTTR